MKEKYMWAAIVILIALVLGLTGYIYEQGYDAKGTPARPGSGQIAPERVHKDRTP